MSSELEFQDLVDQHYTSLYVFALGLSQTEAEACDLTQETFRIWAAKGHQLRDRSAVKTWLFTTLHREFLRSRRRHTRFPHVELDESDPGLPLVASAVVELLDSSAALAALGQLDDTFRAPITLFYLEDCSYQEIATILEIPLGTVKSRIARAIGQLQRLLADTMQAESGAQAVA